MKQEVAKKLISRILSKAAVAALILSLGMNPVIVRAEGTEDVFAEVKTDTTEYRLFQNEATEAVVVLPENDFVYVYSSASATSEIVGKLYNDNKVTILNSNALWSYIQSGSVEGYVSSTILTTDKALMNEAAISQTITVTAQGTIMREKASVASTEEGIAVKGDTYEVTGSANDEWIEVKTDEEETAFINCLAVEVEGEYTCGETLEEEKIRLEEEAEAAKPMGEKVIDYAMQFVGNPYVYGGCSLTKGTDCSGYVMSVYAHFDVKLPHSSYSLRSEGEAVGLDELLPGDIICYEGHVGLYAGDGKIVHASNSRTGIVVGDMYYRQPIGARRIFR